jgi:hypothetical protein
MFFSISKQNTANRQLKIWQLNLPKGAAKDGATANFYIKAVSKACHSALDAKSSQKCMLIIMGLRE